MVSVDVKRHKRRSGQCCAKFYAKYLSFFDLSKVIFVPSNVKTVGCPRPDLRPLATESETWCLTSTKAIHLITIQYSAVQYNITLLPSVNTLIARGMLKDGYLPQKHIPFLITVFVTGILGNRKNYSGRGSQDGHLDFNTTREL